MVCAILVPAATHAAIIYDNGLPDHAGGATMNAFRVADDFTLAADATIDLIRFWYAESGNAGDTPDQFGGSITWAIFSDNGGALDALLHSATVGSLTPTIEFSSSLDFFEVAIPLAVPVNLTAGTYWLEVHHGTSLIDGSQQLISWAYSSSAAGNAKQGDFLDGILTEPQSRPAYDRDVEFAFQLEADGEVPEPSTISLMLVAGVGLLALRKKRAHRV